MDRAAPSVDFAAIGHQDSWHKVSDFINAIRGDLTSLPLEKVKDIYSFIPPRDLFRINVKSLTGAEVNGVFIETFIDPERLDSRFMKSNISKVKAAARCAEKLHAGVAALGGFTSILLEGEVDRLSLNGTKFTTGNTLTSAFIVKGIERAAELLGLELRDASILIIGATGDIGMACTNYFKSKAKCLLLCARNRNRLAAMAETIRTENCELSSSTRLEDLLPGADIIISVASSAGIRLTGCKKGALVCDAGYPKNLEQGVEDNEQLNLFHGGMGVVHGGYSFDPDYSETFYKYAAPHVVHGCLLEAMVLAFERKVEAYSFGKGNITNDRLEEIYNLSQRHGITLAPFFNAKGLWETKNIIHAEQ